MKIFWGIFGALIFSGVGLFTLLNLKSDETLISASYQMLACEKCFHMTIEQSKKANLIGETIIPVSSKVDIEAMIDSIALTKEPLCLRGKFYRFNLNLLRINPDGKRFEIIAKENPEVCIDL